MTSLPTRDSYFPRPSLEVVDSTILMQARRFRASSVPRNVSITAATTDVEEDSGPHTLSSRKRAVSDIDNIWPLESSEVDEEEAKQRRSSRDKDRSSSSDNIWGEAGRIQDQGNIEQLLPAISSPPHSQIPRMTIAILVVGTRGDVQPFCAVALRLRDQFGHRVRLATHAIYREFVESLGLEFYPLAGDPKSLSAFMVKTKGSLFPSSIELLQLMADQPTHLAEIARSTWPAVSAPDPANADVPFSCDAIIANPVCWGHYHVAEALGVPLHIMFPQPWSPTREFPHPMSRLPYDGRPSFQNQLSYTAMDIILWAPIAHEVNCFRRDILRIPMLRVGEAAATVVSDLKVPMSFMWSPSLCPKAKDWGDHIAVLGNIFLDEDSTGGSTFEPSLELAAFLAPSPPIFVGFGSMMIREPARLTRMIIAAAEASQTRVLIQSSWSSMSDGVDAPPPNVFFLGPAPHDWLLPKMCAVVHHGGAGTVAAGLRYGKPTFVCPFFGDQHFWGHCVNESGVGLPPCPIEKLTEAILTDAFLKLAQPKSSIRTHAERMAKQWGEGEISSKSIMETDSLTTSHPEDGITNATSAFHSQLPLHNMCCDVTNTLLLRARVARWIHISGAVKVCDEVLQILTSENGPTSLEDWRKWTPVKWGSHTVGGGTRISAVMDGYKRGMGALLHETVQGVADLVRQPYLGVIEAKQNKKMIGLAKGTARGVMNVVTRPLQGAFEFVDNVATGHVAAVTGKPSENMYQSFVSPAITRNWGEMVEEFTAEPRRKRAESIEPTTSFGDNGAIGFEPIDKDQHQDILLRFVELIQTAEGVGHSCVPILIGRS